MKWRNNKLIKKKKKIISNCSGYHTGNLAELSCDIAMFKIQDEISCEFNKIIHKRRGKSHWQILLMTL